VWRMLSLDWETEAHHDFWPVGMAKKKGLMVPRRGGAVRITNWRMRRLISTGRGGFGGRRSLVRRGAESEQFIRDVTKAVPSRKADRLRSVAEGGSSRAPPSTQSPTEAIGDGRRYAGRASQRAMFRWATWAAAPTIPCSQQHLGVPSSDMSSSGPLWRVSTRVRHFCLVQEIWGPGFSLTNRRWRGSLAWRHCAWRTPTCALRLRRVWKRSPPLILTAAGKTSGEQIWKSRLDFNAVTLAAKHFQDAGNQDSWRSQKNPPRAFGALEPGGCAARACAAGSRGTAAPSLVSSCNLRSRGYTGYAAVVIRE